jgi:23S rRNA (cytidine1920-2'-O)/16S rRNA (cytidine1409-2'-O)-methyltransferase
LKERIDLLLVRRGLVSTREKAQAYLMAGSVFVDGQLELKSGTKTDVNANIELKTNPLPFVSRGGLKLADALTRWRINLEGCVCVDIGASTGGFTDVMLQRGAARVYAIDVGYGQLAHSLRTDVRVIAMERVNIRYLKEDAIPCAVDFVTIDVSFISLKLVLPVAARLLRQERDAHAAQAKRICAPIGIVALVKPQFEAGRAQVGKGGIVRDAAVHESVIENVKRYAQENDLLVVEIVTSPITGAKGNKEFLMWLR